MGGVCDFVILLDATGSMQGCIDAVRNNIDYFIGLLEDDQAPLTDWRARVVGYRDKVVDGSHWIEMHPFVRNDGAALREQLQTLEAKGGGDEPESLLDALYEIVAVGADEFGSQELSADKWRDISEAPRIVILFTDASYHATFERPEGTGTLEDIVNLLQTENVKLLAYAPDEAAYDDLCIISGSQHYAVLAVGSEKDRFQKGLVQLTGDESRFRDVLRRLSLTLTNAQAAMTAQVAPSVVATSETGVTESVEPEEGATEDPASDADSEPKNGSEASS